ncbi:MAG TPA: hypothetical protein VGF40_07320, partial [Thermoanaerobaculia bacterium]
GESDAVVTPASAAHLSLLGEIKSMPKNHRGLAKAESRDDPPCAVVLDFIEKCRERMIDRRFRLAADRASAEFRGDLLRHDWTEEEEEHIVLAEDPAGANGERPLRCSVRNVRRGGRFRRELAICFRREQVALSGKPTDFDIVLGRGLMEDSAYGRAVLSLAAPDLRDRVKSLRVSIAGTSFEYAPVRFESGRHWAIQTYGCTGAPEGVARYDEMTIETETVFDRSCGWYHYFSPRTIIDALVVDLTAPFPIRTRIQFGARSRDAKLSEQPLGDTHFSQVVVRGPVPRRSTVDWYFMD